MDAAIFLAQQVAKRVATELPNHTPVYTDKDAKFHWLKIDTFVQKEMKVLNLGLRVADRKNADTPQKKVVRASGEKRGGVACVNRVGSMLTLFVGAKSISNFADVQSLDPALFRNLFAHLFDNGVFLPPSQFETWFISSVHRDTELDRAAHLICSYITQPRS